MLFYQAKSSCFNVIFDVIAVAGLGGTRDERPHSVQICFIFVQFLAKIMPNYASLGLAPPLGNPGIVSA